MAPSATYRLQLRPEFGFEDAGALVGYLADLGVSHLYLSPILAAVPGSPHGYDVVDHRRINDELGGRKGFNRLADAARRAGLGIVVDVVPNHMSIADRSNRWWWDVLENGPSSAFASYFDVTWSPPEDRLRNRVLMPVLGDHYGAVLDSGELQVGREGADFVLRYHDHTLPLAPRSLPRLLERAAAAIDDDHLGFVASAYHRLPESTDTSRDSLRIRHRDKEVLRDTLARLLERDDVAKAIDGQLDAINRDVSALHELLEEQNHRIAHWRTAAHDLDYRRFFDINTLVGLRVEDPDVFHETHELMLQLVEHGDVAGLRIDHPDGLLDPTGYLDRLERRAPGAWIVVEKILEPGEHLPPWPVAGTTGYDFIHIVNGLLFDPDGEPTLTAIAAERTGEHRSHGEIVDEAKRMVLREILAADVTRLVDVGVRMCEARIHQRDHTRHDLTVAVRALAASFDVYRTYVVVDEHGCIQISDADIHHIDQAVARVRDSDADVDDALLEYLHDLLTCRLPDVTAPEVEFVMRFQQLTGPATAKSVEDTAFYRDVRFVAANEVGGSPAALSVDVDTFHDHNGRIQVHWAETMLTLSTHDTKRSADVRARLQVLSEVPERWHAFIDQVWPRFTELWDGEFDPHAAYLLAQTVVGAWPLSAERATAYMEKATKEAKLRTTWTDPDADYDDALARFVTSALDDDTCIDAIDAMVADIVVPGRINALAQLLLLLTCPGIPDLYQGTELWDLSLVDPDNRRPVDYDQCRAVLARVTAGETPVDVAEDEIGETKAWTIHHALSVRARHPEAFGHGAEGRYVPLPVTGPDQDRAVAFGRGGDVVVVVPRHPAGRPLDGEASIELSSGTWTDAMSGRTHRGGSTAVADLLAEFPVALLERS